MKKNGSGLKPLKNKRLLKRFLFLTGVKKDSGKMIFNPLAEYVIVEGDRLIAMGEDENVKRFAKACLK